MLAALGHRRQELSGGVADTATRHEADAFRRRSVCRAAGDANGIVCPVVFCASPPELSAMAASHTCRAALCTRLIYDSGRSTVGIAGLPGAALSFLLPQQDPSEAWVFLGPFRLWNHASPWSALLLLGIERLRRRWGAKRDPLCGPECEGGAGARGETHHVTQCAGEAM